MAKSYIVWNEDDCVLLAAEIARDLYTSGLEQIDRSNPVKTLTVTRLAKCIATVFGTGPKARTIASVKVLPKKVSILVPAEFDLVKQEHEAPSPVESPVVTAPVEPPKQIDTDLLTAQLFDKLYPMLLARLEKDYVLVPIKPTDAPKTKPEAHLPTQAPKVAKPTVLVYGLLADQANRLAKIIGHMECVFLDSSRKWPSREIPECSMYVVITSFANHSTANTLSKRGALLYPATNLTALAEKINARFPAPVKQD